MDADASLHPSRNRRFGLLRRSAACAPVQTDLHGYSGAAQGLSFTPALIALHRESPAGRKTAL